MWNIEHPRWRSDTSGGSRISLIGLWISTLENSRLHWHIPASKKSTWRQKEKLTLWIERSPSLWVHQLLRIDPDLFDKDMPLTGNDVFHLSIIISVLGTSFDFCDQIFVFTQREMKQIPWKFRRYRSRNLRSCIDGIVDKKCEWPPQN